ncbi:hypothetical protein SDC9_89100 [bioreactor metagenome]|uniref:Uncharacterized protein n=1 Tax=bioreactor metagenome TaxID=1076179 RepID=A0A644ZNF6_9ZZZZ
MKKRSKAHDIVESRLCHMILITAEGGPFHIKSNGEFVLSQVFSFTQKLQIRSKKRIHDVFFGKYNDYFLIVKYFCFHVYFRCDSA